MSESNKILITGARGLLGKRLQSYFRERGSMVVPIIRVPNERPVKDAVAWNPRTGWLDLPAMENAELIIHLAGENVGDGRWTRRKKHRILHSRQVGTQQLVDAVAQLKTPPKTFFSASATGFYGNSRLPCTENEPAGSGFLSSVCVAWEKEANRMTRNGTRVVLLRFGVILDPAGGALKKLLLPFRLGFGGRVGSGDQYFPWISAPEVPKILEALWLHHPTVSGPVNIVAPQPVTSVTFTKALAKHLRRPHLLPLPSFAVKTLFGEMGNEMLLSGCQAVPSVLTELQYSFDDADLDQALKTLLPR